MKKKLFFLTLLALPIITNSAPLPKGVAINSNSKECGAYWGGDEFTSYKLPEGWEAYYPIDSILKTPFGKCNFKEGEKKCCSSLGLVYTEEVKTIMNSFERKDNQKHHNKVIPENNPAPISFLWLPFVLPIIAGTAYIGFVIYEKFFKEKEVND